MFFVLFALFVLFFFFHLLSSYNSQGILPQSPSPFVFGIREEKQKTGDENTKASS